MIRETGYRGLKQRTSITCSCTQGVLHTDNILYVIIIIIITTKTYVACFMAEVFKQMFKVYTVKGRA